ncbi:hypothetical protein B0P06_006093 [Clostridium saccharoperbutylacetonicum]|uniref:Uncharacterized protein n=2 Tax=Clostridium TaxID=1485 RepID=M1N8H4_9CLOT|nr:hypothetical protein [Clostridium saccharoperbutylacetonicum]AGF59632.1 hypothetical protein Cspa_135p00720 [Clostridium saccharoperbutylacetonicum N1-4(HMT)]NRT64511.1 hypothetical protein [Clostridium saccharoperbutylacetonicum]NSB28986.1 hypothetical protein [Clostridium saccharoperbutylacetonicum]NSB46200.1 hypothetical protein [Clostridium saccharoperbutylacetonicum]
MINMQEYQLRQKDEQYSLELLKEGHGATNYQVNKRITEFFENKTPGLPYFKPITLKKYVRSDKKDYNNMFKNIEQDLKNAFQVYNTQTNYEVLINGDYDMQMEEANHSLDKLILQTELLKKYTETKTAYEPYIIKFNDLSMVSTRNLITHNIPQSTSEIDYDISILRNELRSTPSDKVDISTTGTISVDSSNAKVILNKDITSILSEIITDMLTISTVTSNKEPGTLTLQIDFAENHEASRICLNGCSLYNTNVKLFISEDGTNFLEKSNIAGDSSMSWRFNAMNMKAFRIIFEKTSFDYMDNDNNEFYCYYMFSNLSVYNDKYKKSSVFTSKTIEMEQPVSNITVDPIHELPPHTDIAYFVGFENKNDDVEWKNVEAGSNVDLGLLTNEKEILTYETQKFEFSELARYDKVNKQYYFKVYPLPDNTNLNSIYLRAGHSQWLIERLDVNDRYKNKSIEDIKADPNKGIPEDKHIIHDAVPADKVCHTDDYSKARVTDIAPLDSTVMDIRCERVNNYFIMSQYAICEQETIIENRYITYDVTTETFNAMVLINGRQIFPKNNKYSFKLNAGENLIQIMVLLINHDLTNLDNEDKTKDVKKIKHNFNLLAYCKELYAGPEMQRINYNSLIKNISNQSLKYYSVKKEDISSHPKNEAPRVKEFKNVIVTVFDLKNKAEKIKDPHYYDNLNLEVNVPDVPMAMGDMDYNTKEKAMDDGPGDGPIYDENNDVLKPSDDGHYPPYHSQEVYMNNTPYFRMYITYKHMLNSTKEYLKNAKGNSNVRLRIMAKLSTADYTVSPAINSIKIVGE